MKYIFRYMKVYTKTITFGAIIKFIGTFSEFLIPFVLEHLLDDVAPTKDLKAVLMWGGIMILIAVFIRFMNVTANRMAVGVAKKSIYSLRKELFQKTLALSGSRIDYYGLPSLTSRMTADSYNVQNFIRSVQTMGIRAPILLIGGVAVTLIMDPGLASVLLIMLPLLIFTIMRLSLAGIPLYERVQQSLDHIVRILRENITGIRVVKALSKEKHETSRYREANRDMLKKDIKASVIMSFPGPLTTLLLNIGLTAVVIVGAYRVDSGITKPGVILAFLTYFNMILNGVNGVNKIFIMMSKANASAKRIGMVLDEGISFEKVYPPEENTAAGENAAKGEYSAKGACSAKGEYSAKGACSREENYIEFRHVDFGYLKSGEAADEKELMDIDFAMPRGSSLGIIGATGSGKTTIANLLMRFYDTGAGSVRVDGKDVREYDVKELRRKFGVVFQNDVIFADTLLENIALGRAVDEGQAMEACRDAQASGFVEDYSDGLQHKAEIHGANLSGGQKQRILIARALAKKPEVLILDDASSALDYQTDALLRQVIREKYNGITSIIIAQRISSVMNLDRIMVLDEGRIIGMGTHDELMSSCALYREMQQIQMT